MHLTEAIAAYLGLVCAWYSFKQNIWTWPTGIISSALYIIVLLNVKLYADTVLQIIYIIMLFYGWWCWSRGARANDLPITSINLRQSLVYWLILFIGTIVVMEFLKKFTDSQTIFFDAWTTVASLIAQYFLAKKIIQTWHSWFVIDAAYMILYWYKGLYYSTILYVLLTGLAVISYIGWRREFVNKEHLDNLALANG